MRDGDAAKGRAFLWRAVRAQPFNPRYVARGGGVVARTGGVYRRLYRLAK